MSRSAGRTVCIALFFTAKLFLVSNACVAANDAALQAEVTAILNEGWISGDAAMTKAEPHLDQAKQLAPADGRPSYAFALVQMHARKLKEAAGTLDALVADQPEDLSAARAQIWVHASLREFPQAIAGMVALSIHLPKDESDLKDSDRAAAKFLGRMFGYLLGPAAELVKVDSLSAKEKLIVDGLSSPLHTAYDEGRNEVDQKFEDLRNPKTPLAGDPAGAPAASPAASGAFDPNDPRIADLKAKFLTDTAALKQKRDPLQAQYNQLLQRAAPLDAQYQQHMRTAQAKQAQAQATQNNPGQANNLRNDARRELDAAARVQQDINRLKPEVDKLRGDAAAIDRELAQLSKTYRTEAAKMTAGGPNPAAPKPAVAATPAGNPQQERLVSLTTYVSFSLTTEKQRVLDSFSK